MVCAIGEKGHQEGNGGERLINVTNVKKKKVISEKIKRCSFSLSLRQYFCQVYFK